MSRDARRTTLRTPDGVRIAAQEWGDVPGPAVVFIHGYSQCHLSWSRQVSGGLAERFRLLTYDLRGHGASDKPETAEYYQDGARWADELEAVLDHFALDRAIIVAWSYGGRVVSDYLHRHGAERIAGINLVGSKTRSDPQFTGAGIREMQAEMASPDLATSIPATISFLKACARRWDADEFHRHLAFNMLAPPAVRGHMMGRSFDADEIYRNLDRPVLFTHGTDDLVVPLSAAEAGHRLAPASRLSVYEGIGHAPFLEAPDRFNAELAAFAGTWQSRLS